MNELSELVKIEDLKEVLKTVGLIKEKQNIEASGITETEKKRFNSNFEILQGEKLEYQAVLNLINAIKENFVEIEIVSNKQLKLKIDRTNKNEKVAETLTTFIEENKNRKYDAKVEYDEATGLVSDIVLIMREDK